MVSSGQVVMSGQDEDLVLYEEVRGVEACEVLLRAVHERHVGAAVA